jgi:hypothetical protein
MNNFETWLKADFPEADISRHPSGEYRLQSVRDMSRAYAAAMDFAYSEGYADGMQGIWQGETLKSRGVMA